MFFTNTNGFDMFRYALPDLVRLAIDLCFINLGDRILAGYSDDGDFGGCAVFCEDRLWHMYLSEQGALMQCHHDMSVYIYIYMRAKKNK